MNGIANVSTRMDVQQMQRVLEMNGIDFASEQDVALSTAYQCYSLLVYDLHVIEIKKRRPGVLSQMEPMARNERSRTEKVLHRTAIRATYCLGLDTAVVNLCHQDRSTNFYVMSVDPQPSLTHEQRMMLAKAQLQLKQNERRTHHDRAVIGMDLEFILCRTDGKVISAAQFVQRQGSVGYDGIRFRDRTVYPIVELRPQPRIEPRDVFIQLKHTLDEAHTKINNPNLSWVAGGMPKKGFRLGGHIHLSKISLSSRLLRVLDNYLALPFALIEGEGALRRRPRYGFLGDYRHQFHGGFEYRTLPSWIVSPLVAKGVIALVRLIADHYDELQRTPLKEERVQSYYYQGDKALMLPYVHQLWHDLEQTPSYVHYAAELDPFKHRLFTLQAIEETADIRRDWQLI